MLPSEHLVDLSRLQFAVTAMYHFLFVPLTLGLAWILLIMESVYVMTGKEIYKDMTQFWGKLFAINFAMGVVTGLTMEFQFGQNWAYYSYYVGDIFGIPLAIEGIAAFMLESTFLGIFFFGWDRLSKQAHLFATFCLAIGSSMSALMILIANAWMQYPTGAEFNYETMRMELVNFWDVFFNPVAQVKFVHTVAAGYVTGAIFVLSISAYFLLRNRDIAFAKRSFAVAAGFGLAAVLSVIVLGDESGYSLGDVQKTKLAAIEAEWETQKPPAAFNLWGIPNQEKMETSSAIKIPYALGIIATRSLDTPVIGLKEIIEENKHKIRLGIEAYSVLEKLRAGDKSPELKAQFDQVKEFLGYGLLLKNYTDDIQTATQAQIDDAALHSIPNIASTYWSFRLMVTCGIMMLGLFVFSMYFIIRGTVWKKRWFLWCLVFALPLPWVAAEAGWIVSEVGRQPWVIGGILPTRLGSSSLAVSDVYISLIDFILFYTVLLVVEVYLMLKYIRRGPSVLGKGKYHFEQVERGS
jgi:cytochrome d ubiquinol oxidase subunit I